MKKLIFFLLPIILVTVVGYAKDSSAPTPKNVALAEEVLSDPASSNSVSSSPETDANIDPDAILAMAKDLASRSRYADAITLVEVIPADSSYGLRSKSLRQLWANLILERAEDKLEEGNEQKAFAIFSAVPEDTQAYKSAPKVFKVTQ